MKRQNNCGAMIKQIHDTIGKILNNALRPYGLTMSQMNILLLLNESDQQQLSLKDLEQLVHVAQSTTVGLISRLEQKKLVETFGDAKDKRIKKVRITPDGIARCQLAEAHMAQTESYLLSQLTPIEQETFLTLLKKIRDGMCS